MIPLMPAPQQQMILVRMQQRQEVMRERMQESQQRTQAAMDRRQVLSEETAMVIARLRARSFN